MFSGTSSISNLMILYNKVMDSWIKKNENKEKNRTLKTLIFEIILETSLYQQRTKQKQMIVVDAPNSQ